MSADRPHRLVRPIFVVAAPGSGADTVVEALAQADGLTTLSATLSATLSSGLNPLAAAAALNPSERGFDSARLARVDARPSAVTSLEEAWAIGQGERLVTTWHDAALQIPFLAAAWPDATFVFLQRDPSEALASMAQAWSAGSDITHPGLPEWSGPGWSLALVPGWRSLPSDDLIALICAQWSAVADLATAELRELNRAAWTSLSIHEIAADPALKLAELGHRLGLTWTTGPTFTPPSPIEALTPAALGEHLPRVADSAQRVREMLGHAADRSAAGNENRTGFESVATTNIAQLLTLLNSSVVATTYQSGRVVTLRARGGQLNTHFRAFPKPMGIAYRPGVMALGTRSEVITMVDVPGLAEQAGPEHDAIFVPRTRHATGDIRIHDVGWVGDELWAVNTRFSCLVTFDATSSFVPRWQPPFISALAPEDRCHLNGMAIVGDRVKYVTALGTTDTPGGWRPTKAGGGVIIDVETDQVIASGLSMPHSPRWYRDKLWVLESGQGSLATVDPASGEVTTVATLPGFTRGLAFAGRYAFVGLSQVREATTFGGLPLTARLEDRQCGIWVVDIETGETMGFVRFEGKVEEIFDVVLLPQVAFPDIVEPDSPILEQTYVLP